MSLPAGQRCTHVVTSCCWRNKGRLVWLYWERPLEACSWLPLDFTPYAFSLCWFTLYRFPVINHSPEYGCKLSPTESSQWISTPDSGLGDPQHNIPSLFLTLRLGFGPFTPPLTPSLTFRIILLTHRTLLKSYLDQELWRVFTLLEIIQH